MPEIHSINTGFFRLDGGTMFGIVPRVLWQKEHRPDEQNRILQALRVLLVIDGERKILVDVGLGNWHNQKLIDMYEVEEHGVDFDDALGRHGICAEDITDVVITHLHFDHAGALVTKKDSQIQPTFPNARIWLQKQHWLWARNPSPRDKASFMDGYLNMLSDWPKLELAEGKTNITADVSLLVFDGHSPAMQTVLITDRGRKHFFASDLIPTASHLRIPYITAYDNNPALTAEEKTKILSQACRENWLIYFPHDPVYEKGFVTTEKGKYVLKKDCSF